MWKDAKPRKQPYYIRRKDGEPFSLAAIWDYWEGQGQRISSCSIVVTRANTLLGPIHDRMPVILEPKDYDRWLDPREGSGLLSLLEPYEGDELEAYPVSTAVNDPKNDSADLIESDSAASSSAT